MTRQLPWLVYDADCGFCTSSAKWIAQDGELIEAVAWQSLPSLEALGLTIEEVTTAAYWIAKDGQRKRGAEAIGMALTARGGVAGFLGRVILSRPVRPLARFTYTWVAANRYRMPGGTAACKVKDQRPN